MRAIAYIKYDQLYSHIFVMISYTSDIWASSQVYLLLHWIMNDYDDDLTIPWSLPYYSDFLLQKLPIKKSKLCNIGPFMREIHRWPVDSPPRGTVMWNVLPCHYVIMLWRPAYDWLIYGLMINEKIGKSVAIKMWTNSAKCAFKKCEGNA